MALALPPDALIDRRVPKTLLIENGAFAAGDRRRIQEGIEELRWLAALKPASVDVAEYRDAEREYLEIAVLKLDLRPAAHGERLVELVHRAVPYPVLLIAWRDGTPELSLAHKRQSLGEVDKTVIDSEIIVARSYGDCAHEPVTAFRDALALARQPRDTLHALYQGWIDTVQAFRTATITGAFCLPITAAAAADREAALREYRSLDDRIANIHSAASKEKQMSRRAEMNMELARLRAEPRCREGETVRERRVMEKIVVGDPETRSADVVADNLERLQALFPEAFSEGKVDFEVLRQLLGGAVDESEEKYRLNWHGKRRARQLALTPSTGHAAPVSGGKRRLGYDAKL